MDSLYLAVPTHGTSNPGEQPSLSQVTGPLIASKTTHTIVLYLVKSGVAFHMWQLIKETSSLTKCKLLPPLEPWYGRGDVQHCTDSSKPLMIYAVLCENLICCCCFVSQPVWEHYWWGRTERSPRTAEHSAIRVSVWTCKNTHFITITTATTTTSTAMILSLLNSFKVM